MAKFTGKQIAVDAIRVADVFHNASKSWNSNPEWIMSHYDDGDLLFLPNCIVLNKPSDNSKAEFDDWLVHKDGVIYPCRADVFALLFEAEA